jgi:general secretion pathway protein J
MRSRGFSLIEVLVALVVFAAMAAITWGALGQVVRTRAALAAQQDRFAAIVRAVGDLERDLRHSVSRPVRGTYGEVLPALVGGADRIELSRIGFADPRAEQRSNIERVGYRIEDGTLRRERWRVLDRAANSRAEPRDLLDRVVTLQLRYLADDGRWADAWPPRDARRERLPRAVEWRLALSDFGELRRVIVLPTSLPERAAEAAADTPPPIVSVGGASP